MSFYYRSTKTPCGDALISMQSKLYFCDSDTHTLNEILVKITNWFKVPSIYFLIKNLYNIRCWLSTFDFTEVALWLVLQTKKFFGKKKKMENEVCNKDASKSLSSGVHLSTLPNNSMTLKSINVLQILKTYHKSPHF